MVGIGRTAIVALLAWAVILSSAARGDGAHAQQFSADLLSMSAGDEPARAGGRIYAANGKVRIETPDLPDSFLLVDARVPAAYLVRPAQRVYMDSKQSSRLTQLFAPLDPAEPCRRWQALAELAGAADANGRWRCDSTGHETVGGRDAIRYRVTTAQARQGTAWVDSRLDFLLRITFDDGAGDALDNLQEGPQPSSLFEIPAGYRKFDPAALIRIIKQSDVWVEQPR